VIDRTWIDQITYLFEKYTLPIRSALELVLFFRSFNLFFGGGSNNRRNNNRRNN
jgi:hypothetical protein